MKNCETIEFPQKVVKEKNVKKRKKRKNNLIYECDAKINKG